MKNPIPTVQHVLAENKAAFQDQYGDHMALYEEIEAFFQQDLAELLCDAGKKKKKADREAFLEPFIAFGDRIRGFFPVIKQKAVAEKRNYNAMEEAYRWDVEPAFAVTLGWMKSLHLYRRNELNPPATEAELQAVQEHIGHPLPGAMIQSLQIANGMASNMLRFQGRMTFLSTDEMHGAFDLLKNFAREFPDKYISKEHLASPILPIAQNGAGAYWFFDLKNFPNFLMQEFDHESDWPRPVNSFFTSLINEPHKLKRG